MVSTDKILDKMMDEIMEARKVGKLEDIQKHAGRIQLLCELLLDEQIEQKHEKHEKPIMLGSEKIKPTGRTNIEDEGDSLLDF